jgi:hypothetical protein
LGWTIRAVGGLDLDELAALVQRCLGPGWGRAGLELALESRFARIRTATQQAGDLIGFVIGRRITDFLEINLLGVTPNE